MSLPFPYNSSLSKREIDGLSCTPNLFFFCERYNTITLLHQICRANGTNVVGIILKYFYLHIWRILLFFLVKNIIQLLWQNKNKKICTNVQQSKMNYILILCNTFWYSITMTKNLPELKDQSIWTWFCLNHWFRWPKFLKWQWCWGS